MKKDDALRRKLAETFEDFEAEPQVETWENIRKAIRPKRKRRPVLIWFSLAGLGLLTGAGLFCLKNSKNTFLTISAPAWKPAPQTNAGVSPTMQVVVGSPTQQTKETSPPTSNLYLSRNSTSRLPAQNQIRLPAAQGVNSAIPTTQTAVAAEDRPAASQQPGVFKYETTKDAAITISTEKKPLATSDVMQHVVKPADLAALPSPPLRALTITQQLLLPQQTKAVVVLPDEPKRKGAFTAGATLLLTYQWMESQLYEGFAATRMQELPTFDTRRLGAAWSAGYRLPLRRRSDINVALSWMNMPYRAAYGIKNTHQARVEIESATQYRVLPVVESTVSESKRVNWWGLQLDYGYTYSLFNQHIRIYAGGEALLQAPAGQLECWTYAGLDIPLGSGKYQIAPVFKYQIRRIEQPDHLLKTRLYGLGIGIKRIF